jgi:hypothetical protein
MTPEQKLWGAVLCQMLIDALSSPPEDTDEYEEQVLSDWQVTQMDWAFCYSCQAVGLDPNAIRASYLDGRMTRDSIYYVFNRLTQ